ncbi:hypothetical protein ACFL1G_01275 [Planctomycetota bacterium]
MNLNSRKLFVWLIALLVAVVAYKLYIVASDTPLIEMNKTTGFPGDVGDSNEARSRGGGGRIGDFVIETVEKARFTDLNEKTGEVEREFGFEKIIYKEGKEWEIEKPYMNIFRPDFSCYITAEKGKVIIEDAVDKPNPTDATLIGSVVIHIIPEKTGNLAESFLYLDKVVYIAEKSKISTSGSVRFVSGNARINGKGLELIYNNQLDRLDFMRIVHLESLRLRSSELSLLSSEQRKSDVVSAPNTEIRQKPSDELAGGGTTRAIKTESSPEALEQKGEDYYRCVFNKNVLVETPGQIIFADRISINNILRSKRAEQEENSEGFVSEGSKENQSAAAAEKQDDVGTLTKQSSEVIVTCDDGVVIMPADFTSTSEQSSQPASISAEIDKKKAAAIKGAKGITTYIASGINYNVSTGDIVSVGPSELIFYIDDLYNERLSVPATISSKERVTFLRADNRVIFEGDCLCSMVRDNEGIEERYTLSAPRIIVTLSEKKQTSSELPTRISHIIADGGTVKLATVKTNNGKLIGGVELKCSRFDYDAGGQFFEGTGPGIIKVDNSNITEPQEESKRFSLRRRCYALVENFDTLKYFLQLNKIIAEAQSQFINIGYAPIIEGEYGPATKANAGRIEADFYETEDGRFEIKSLSATDGIVCQNEDVQFEGSEMLFDAGESIIRARGDGSVPCLLNGAPVDGVEYNVKTGEGEAKIIGPGMLQLGR